jgi:hypothetical protein
VTCHLYPEHTTLPPLPSSVQLDPDAPMEASSAAMEGEFDPGRADAQAALADELAGEGPTAAPGSSAAGIGDLAQSDLDEMHHRRDH